MSQDLSSAAVVIGALRVNIFEVWLYSNLFLSPAFSKKSGGT